MIGPSEQAAPGGRPTKPRDTLPTRRQSKLPEHAKEDPLHSVTVLEEEFRVLHGPPPKPADKATDLDRLKTLFTAIHNLEEPRTALCLSGGGIRSATFALGVLQGLARHRLLKRFHYLSTVSGGGYLGSWLSAWISHEEGSAESVESQLRGDGATVLNPEASPIDRLRSYSNYLTPRLGLLSADTWTVVATVLRNLLLNWLLLIPVIAAAGMLPRLWMMALSLSPPSWFAYPVIGLALVLGVLGLSYIAADMPSVGNLGRPQGSFLAWCLFPLVAAVFLSTTFWAWRADSLSPEGHLIHFVVGGIALHALAMLATAFKLKRSIKSPLLGVALLTGAAGGLAAWALLMYAFRQPTGAELPAYVVFVPGVLLALLALIGTLFVGFTSRITNDQDREWWARSGGWVLIVLSIWTGFAAISIFSPQLPNWIATTVGSTGGIAGLLTAVLGYRGKIPLAGERPKNGGHRSLTDLVIILAAPVFTVGLLILVSIGTATLVSQLTGELNLLVAAQRFEALGIGLLVAGALVAIAVLMSGFLDTNNFSLHSMYRNRLVRAYLGTARPAGSRNDASPFTGLAPSDDLPMASLARSRLFHVLNLTLNVVASNRLAWQERKAESFTVSPLHCGSGRVGYRPTSGYAGGMSLGSAATMSGAAASPNMGYHSSPAITFLMTFFNARLGCWLGNPGDAGFQTWFKAGPRPALRPILSEAFGRTDDQTPHVYLSDGGHFENLGLYEMVQRRCHIILVSDAGSDSHFTFGDLGNAVRKIRIDLGIPIVFRGRTLLQTLSGDEGKYGAVADICYNLVDPKAADGLLVYIKPSLNGTEPADIRNYKSKHPDFPHESTADQWFSESQFESYRMLGLHVIEEICGTVTNDLFAFGNQAIGYLGPPLVSAATALPAAPKPLATAQKPPEAEQKLPQSPPKPPVTE
jgi:hypothetical protein